jgi:hypothetical protein
VPLSTPLFSLIMKIEIRHMSISDHHAYYCQIQMPEPPKRTTRFNDSLLQNHTFCEQFQTELS